MTMTQSVIMRNLFRLKSEAFGLSVVNQVEKNVEKMNQNAQQATKCLSEMEDYLKAINETLQKS